MIRFSTTVQKFDSNLWGYHFPVPIAIADKFVTGNDRRIVCKINNAIQIQGALMPYSEGYFILINQGLIKRLRLSIGENVNLEIEKDKSEFGLPMPDSFRALLDQDSESTTLFNNLTPGKKRSLIYLVGKVKNIDSQLNKGLAIVEHLKTEKGILNYKKLHQLIKAHNQRSKLK